MLGEHEEPVVGAGQRENGDSIDPECDLHVSSQGECCIWPSERPMTSLRPDCPSGVSASYAQATRLTRYESVVQSPAVCGEGGHFAGQCVELRDQVGMPLVFERGLEWLHIEAAVRLQLATRT